VILYGIASAVSDDIQDWYLSRKEADATLTATLRDEPDFEGELWVEGGRVRAEPPSRPEPPDAFTTQHVPRTELRPRSTSPSGLAWLLADRCLAVGLDAVVRVVHALVDVDRCVQHSHRGLLRLDATTVNRPSEAPS
jgi:hypothetical protein